MRRLLVSSALALSLGLLAPRAGADPVLRVQVDQKGDFLMFGNSTGYECGNGALAPLVGDVNCPSSTPANQNDSSPDLFWRADEPGVGEATADNGIDVNEARSTAMFALPPDATVTHARIYWAGLKIATGGADEEILVDREDGSLSQAITADASTIASGASGGNIWYQATADVTDLLTANGEGPYRVSGIGSIDLRSINNNDPMLGWVIVVFYGLDSEPPRNLALFDGLTVVPTNSFAQVSIDGFFVPDGGFDAKLGVIAYEGEAVFGGDALQFNGALLSDTVNPIDNFFNGSRSFLGTAVTTLGDLPQLSGEANSMSGVDLDVIDVTNQLDPGDSSATVRASSGGEQYLLGAFITSISSFKPDFQTSTKSFEDLNGGAIKPGEELEYTIVVNNTGNDTSVDTVLTDELPEGLDYVPGSLEITDGANAGPLTDEDGDDQGEYDDASRTLTVRLGAGADDSQGGELAPEGTTTVTFQVTVAPGTIGDILNQAVITAEGLDGAPATDTPTDGDDAETGPQPTTVSVEGCEEDADCGSGAARCDATADPKVCVECLSDTDCSDPAEPECLNGGVCGCPAGEGECETAAGGQGGEGGAPAPGGTGGTAGSAGTGGSGGGGSGGVAPATPTEGTIEGGGISCRTSGGANGPGSLTGLLAALCGVFALGWRRARRVSSRACND